MKNSAAADIGDRRENVKTPENTVQPVQYNLGLKLKVIKPTATTASSREANPFIEAILNKIVR